MSLKLTQRSVMQASTRSMQLPIDSESDDEGEDLLALVRSLPDHNVAPAVLEKRIGDDGRTLTQRLEDKRRERHALGIEELQDELAALREELEVRTQRLGVQTKAVLAGCKSEVDEAIASARESLANLNMQEIEHLHDLLEAKSEQQHESIGIMFSALDELERERVDRIGEALKSSSKLLKAVAFMLPGDVERVLMQEAETANEDILHTRAVIADLQAHLTASYLSYRRLKEADLVALRRDWIELRQVNALTAFKEALKGEDFEEQRARLRSDLTVELEDIQQRRARIMQEAAMATPNELKEVNSAWFNQFKTAQEAGRTACDSYIDRHASLLNDFESFLEEKINQLQVSLVSAGVCDGTEAAAVVLKEYTPLLQDRIRSEREEGSQYNTSLEAQETLYCERSQVLRMILEEANTVFAKHVQALSTCPRQLQTSLDTVQQEYHPKLKELQAELDMNLDQLRQGANERELKGHLRACMDKLSAVERQYRAASDMALSKTSDYPQSVVAIVGQYEKDLCAVLSVADSGRKSSVRPPSNSAKKSTAKQPLVTSSGVTFLVAKVKRPVSGRASTARASSATSDRGSAKPRGSSRATSTSTKQQADISTLAPAGVLSEDDLTEALRALKLSWLEHLESHTRVCELEANSFIEEKALELQAELEMQLGVLAPRRKLFEQDVHNVRAAELVLHRDRVTRHCKAMEESLLSSKSHFTRTCEGQDELCEQFRVELSSLQAKMRTANMSSKLVALQEQARKITAAFRDNIQQALVSYRQVLEDSLRALRESNGSLRVSFRAFSEGGNFCSQEIVEYSEILEALSSRIDQTETQILSGLEGLAVKYAKVASDALKEFDNENEATMREQHLVEKTRECLSKARTKMSSELNLSLTKSRDIDAGLERLRLNLSDRTDASAGDVLVQLGVLLELLTERSKYLDCLAKVPQPPKSPASVRSASTVRSRAKSSATSRKSRNVSRAASGRPGTTKNKKTHVTVGSGFGQRIQVEPWVNDQTDTFMCFANSVRVEARVNLFEPCGVFYDRVKSSGKAPTLSKFVRASAQEYIEVVEAELQAMYESSEKRCNEWTAVFKRQCEVCYKLSERVPSVVMNRISKHHQDMLQEVRTPLLEDLAAARDASERERVAVRQSLRPSVGHPSAAAELADLSSREEARRSQFSDALMQHQNATYALFCEQSEGLLQSVHTASESLLQLFDMVFLPSEVIVRGQPEVKKPLRQLLKEHVQGQEANKDTFESSPPRLPAEWDGIPLSHVLPHAAMVTCQKPDFTTKHIKARRAMALHGLVIDARADLIASYKEEFRVVVDRAAAEFARASERMNAEEADWALAVKKLAALYE